MPLREFETARQRIERADTHSKTFAKLWSDLIVNDELYSTALVIDDNGAGGIWIEPRADHLPDSLALEMGELLYQLRAALDSCVYAAAILETGQDPPPDEEKLEFPICSDPGGAEKFKNAGWKLGPLKKERRRIIESIQPYTAPAVPPTYQARSFRRALEILNDWARKDRHRKLHIVGSWVSSASPMLRTPKGVSLESFSLSGDGFLEHQSKIMTFQLAGFVRGMDIKANANSFVDVAIDEPPPPCSREDILGFRIPVMLSATRWVVDAIERSFLDELKPRVSDDPWAGG